MKTEVIITNKQNLKGELDRFFNLFNPNNKIINISISNDGYKENLIALIVYQTLEEQIEIC